MYVCPDNVVQGFVRSKTANKCRHTVGNIYENYQRSSHIFLVGFDVHRSWEMNVHIMFHFNYLLILYADARRRRKIDARWNARCGTGLKTAIFSMQGEHIMTILQRIYKQTTNNFVLWLWPWLLYSPGSCWSFHVWAVWPRPHSVHTTRASAPFRYIDFRVQSR